MQILLKSGGQRPSRLRIIFNKNVKTAITVAQARGAMMQQFAVAKYEIAEYKPQQIKGSCLRLRQSGKNNYKNGAAHF